MFDSDQETRIRKGIVNGDTESFRVLYEKYYSGLCILACRYTGKKEIAEEIVQETFLKIWEGRKKIEITGSFHAYLYTSVRNGCVNYLKHLMLERKFSEDKSKALQQTVNYLQISQEDGSSMLVAEELEKILDEALDSLPPKCREIFLLSRKENLRYSEIAKKLGLTRNTVQRQMSIALGKLRNKLLPHINS